MRTVCATVTAIAMAMAVTVAYAAPVPLEVATVLAYRSAVDLDVPDRPEHPDPLLVEGFGDPAPGNPPAAPWIVPSGEIVWTDAGTGVGKPGGQNGGVNIAVIDAGVRDVRVTATVAGLIDGPRGGAATSAGLSVLSDGGSQQVVVAYTRRTGVLTVATPAGPLGSVDIGAGRSALDTIAVEVRFPELRIHIEGTHVLTLDTIPATYSTHTHHGIHLVRDNTAVFTAFRLEDLS